MDPSPCNSFNASIIALRMSELSDAIEHLYAAFQDYPLPASTYPCPCCHSVDSERPLYSRPLRELREEDLEQYARDALLVWGGVNEFRHFLPRVFEIAALGSGFRRTEREIVFSKLYYGEWNAWPRKEQEAVQQFLLALWRRALEESPSDDLSEPPRIAEWLCVLAQIRSGFTPYFTEWLSQSSPNAAWNLAATIYRTALPHPHQGNLPPFWQDHIAEAQQVADWVHSEAVRTNLKNAFETYVDRPFAEELLAAVNVVSQ